MRGPSHLSDGDAGVPDRDRQLVAQVRGEQSRQVHPVDELTPPDDHKAAIGSGDFDTAATRRRRRRGGGGGVGWFINHVESREDSCVKIGARGGGGLR